MVANATPYKPFYEPGAPPPALPLLTTQTDLLHNPFRPTTLLDAETLPKAGPMRAKHPPGANQATYQRHVRFASHAGSGSSPSPGAAAASAASEDEDDSSSESSASDASESSESESSADVDGLIPKPPGEPGRPGRGGYTLEVALGWNPKAFKKLKVRSQSSTFEHAF